MSSFLNIRSSRLEESCKKVFLTPFAKFIEKNIPDAVFNLKFQSKSSITLLKRLRHMCFPKNFEEVIRTPILQNVNRLLLLKNFLKMTIAAPDKFLVLIRKF